MNFLVTGHRRIIFQLHFKKDINHCFIDLYFSIFASLKKKISFLLDLSFRTPILRLGHTMRSAYFRVGSRKACTATGWRNSHLKSRAGLDARFPRTFLFSRCPCFSHCAKNNYKTCSPSNDPGAKITSGLRIAALKL